MRARTIGLPLLSNLSAIFLARWWLLPGTPLVPPEPAAPPPEEAFSEPRDTDGSTLVPLSDCLAAALGGPGGGGECPTPCTCTPCPACLEAGGRGPSWAW